MSQVQAEVEKQQRRQEMMLGTREVVFSGGLSSKKVEELRDITYALALSEEGTKEALITSMSFDKTLDSPAFSQVVVNGDLHLQTRTLLLNCKVLSPVRLPIPLPQIKPPLDHHSFTPQLLLILSGLHNLLVHIIILRILITHLRLLVTYQPPHYNLVYAAH
jgi:hypothetical protein